MTGPRHTHADCWVSDCPGDSARHVGPVLPAQFTSWVVNWQRTDTATEMWARSLPERWTPPCALVGKRRARPPRIRGRVAPSPWCGAIGPRSRCRSGSTESAHLQRTGTLSPSRQTACGQSLRPVSGKSEGLSWARMEHCSLGRWVCDGHPKRAFLLEGSEIM